MKIWNSVYTWKIWDLRLYIKAPQNMIKTSLNHFLAYFLKFCTKRSQIFKQVVQKNLPKSLKCGHCCIQLSNLAALNKWVKQKPLLLPLFSFNFILTIYHSFCLPVLLFICLFFLFISLSFYLSFCLSLVDLSFFLECFDSY